MATTIESKIERLEIPSTGEMPIVPSDFDVLSDELPGNLYVLDDYNNQQIGNNRLRVLIEMRPKTLALKQQLQDQYRQLKEYFN